MDIKKTIEDIVEKLKKDDGLKKQFLSDPAGALEKLTGIDLPDEQLRIMHGFSVCWELRSGGGALAKAADLYEPGCGRGVETWTTEPGLLTYTGRGLNGKMIGKGGVPLQKFGGMLLETIHFPDSPNRPELPSAILRPGERYCSVTEFRFYAK